MTGSALADGVGEGVGVGVGAATGARVGAGLGRATPLFHTSFFPLFTQVNFFPPVVCVAPVLGHEAPDVAA